MEPPGSGSPQGFLALSALAMLVDPYADAVSDHTRQNRHDKRDKHIFHDSHLLSVPDFSQIGEGQYKYHTIIRQNPQAAGYLNFPCLINIILLRIKSGGPLLQNGILRYALMKKIVKNAVGTIDGHRRLC